MLVSLLWQLNLHPQVMTYTILELLLQDHSDRNNVSIRWVSTLVSILGCCKYHKGYMIGPFKTPTFHYYRASLLGLAEKIFFRHDTFDLRFISPPMTPHPHLFPDPPPDPHNTPTPTHCPDIMKYEIEGIGFTCWAI